MSCTSKTPDVNMRSPYDDTLLLEFVWLVGFPLKKLDSHRFSGLASRCVEWFDPNMERTNREAPSLFAGKNKNT